MRRWIVVVAVITVAVLSMSGIASAKGARSATIKGPGLEEPIRLGNDDPKPPCGNVNCPNALMAAAGLGEVVWNRAGASSRPEGKLGPRYVVTYRWMTGVDETAPIRQRIYPFAEGGAVTFVPAGQSLSDEELDSGWFRAGDELTQLLISFGVPPRS